MSSIEPMFDRPVLGIDPGLSRCGYGAVHVSGGRARAVACGVLRTDPSWALPDRLVALHDELASLMDEIDPFAVSVERVLFQSNVRTAISVGQASGIALFVAARRGIPTAEYSPNEVKLSVTGDGAADKFAVQTMVSRLVGLDAIPSPPDAADALALALTHAWRVRTGGGRDRDREPGGASGFDRAVEAALAREVPR